jgi:rhodanese-related sulfurtransferase
MAIVPPSLLLGIAEVVLARRYSRVTHLPVSKLETLQTRGGGPLVLDARSEAEFGVSHIPGAIRIDPDADVTGLVAAVGGELDGRAVVVYCSVGFRSSSLVARTRGPLLARGASDAYSLRGGLFRWHAEGQPLQDATGSTRNIHPFNSLWGALIAHPAEIKWTPAPPVATCD